MAEPVLESDGASNPSYQPLVVVATAVCAGIVLARFKPASFGLLWTGAAGLWLLWLASWRAAAKNLKLHDPCLSGGDRCGMA